MTIKTNKTIEDLYDELFHRYHDHVVLAVSTNMNQDMAIQNILTQDKVATGIDRSQDETVKFILCSFFDNVRIEVADKIHKIADEAEINKALFQLSEDLKPDPKCFKTTESDELSFEGKIVMGVALTTIIGVGAYFLLQRS